MKPDQITKRIIELFENREFTGGAHAAVFPLDEMLISKVYFPDLDPMFVLNEKKVGVSLFLDGISVPEIYDLIELPEINKKYPGFSKNVLLMERIHGDLVINLYDEVEKRAIKKQNEELKKARNLGYSYSDAECSDNAIYRAEDDRIFLIDFVLWIKK